MIEQLKELLEMQRALDDSILKDKGIMYYPKEKVQIALFVELGELMNELPTRFKYWKSSAVDNREKALEEYVDCLHFALSLTNRYREIFEEELLECPHDFNYNSHEMTLMSQKRTDTLLTDIMEYEGHLSSVFALGVKLGFEWDEIYKAYKDKNAVNYERLRSGY